MVVVGVHLSAVILLMRQRVEQPPDIGDDATALIWAIVPDDVQDQLPVAQPRVAGKSRQVTRPDESSTWMPQLARPERLPAHVDWAAAARAAADAAASNMAPDSDPAPRRSARPFGWDQSHTERWSFPETGGTAIRLNDHCEIIFNPLPVGGCAIGKIAPRGDLFDAMQGPVVLGDWKD